MCDFANDFGSAGHCFLGVIKAPSFRRAKGRLFKSFSRKIVSKLPFWDPRWVGFRPPCFVQLETGILEVPVKCKTRQANNLMGFSSWDSRSFSLNLKRWLGQLSAHDCDWSSVLFWARGVCHNYASLGFPSLLYFGIYPSWVTNNWKFCVVVLVTASLGSHTHHLLMVMWWTARQSDPVILRW